MNFWDSILAASFLNGINDGAAILIDENWEES
jgi:hypothetical protein